MADTKKTTPARSADKSPKKAPAPRKGGSRLWGFFKGFVATCIALALAGVGLALFVFALVYSQLPPIDTVVDYKPKVPMRVWTADGKLIAEFGEERRDFVTINEIPPLVKEALISAEDDGFYQHAGIEPKGFIRAALNNLATGRKSQGASTITMQVARNFFLSSERSYIRKLYEVAMAFKIEANLSKDEILQIYMNQIFLGNRAYGFAAAARTYYGKSLQQLTAGEAATLAGLPAAPSVYNPFASPKRAKMRRDYVLGRMRDLGYISEAEYQKEVNAPIQTRLTRVAEQVGTPTRMNESLHAEYVAELVRTLMFDIFQQETYTRGLNVYTTINSEDQGYAYKALRSHLQSYDHSQGYRGPEAKVDISDPKTREQNISNALQEALIATDMPAVVALEVSPTEVKVQMSHGKVISITGKGLDFVKRALQPKAKADIKIVPGSVLRLQSNKEGYWEITQIPQAEAAFIATEYNTGAIKAMVGGYDFALNKFNHVTQAWRQPGSSFKPFIYSAAIEKGFSPQTVINDAPIVLDPSETGFKKWNPKNFSGKFSGPIMMKDALKKSLNLVSIRILQAITPRYAVDFIQRFGFDSDKHPPHLSMALGAGSVTPWQMVEGFSVFANIGRRPEPYLISKVTDASGKVLMQSTAEAEKVAGVEALDPRNAYIMHQMLHGVATSGTAARATASLKRTDIAGKTGTSNDAFDVWFVGYAGDQCAAVWMGFDQPRSLGRRAQGAGLALPVWIDYMRDAIKNEPNVVRKAPPGVTEEGGNLYYTNRKDAIPNLGLDQPATDDPIGALIHDSSVRGQIF